MKHSTRSKRGSETVILSAAAALLLLVPLLYMCRGAADGEKKEGAADAQIIQSECAPTDMQGNNADELLDGFCKTCGVSRDAYPKELVELLKRNPDTREYVLMYPFRTDEQPVTDLSALTDCEDVPLLLQWDARWGYTLYNDAPMGISGCGPTCLSMALLYLTKDASFTPRFVADYAEKHGYAVKGVGSAWTLISEGGVRLGLDVKELPLDKGRMERALHEGAVIILNVGKGDFTENGHFLVIKGEKDGAFEVNDPNSPTRSSRLWTYEELAKQIRILWACQKK